MLHTETHLISVIKYVQKFVPYDIPVIRCVNLIPVIRYVEWVLTHVMSVIRYAS